jgi:cytochrome c biogenesis protein CcmG/thiol:disulfide interchange protein DsbE
VVNFFASWCAPCHEEADTLLRFSRTPGIVIYGVDYEDQRQSSGGQDGRAFLNQAGNPFSRIVSDAHGRAAIDWGVYGAPETFVVDGRGIIRFKYIGALTDRAISEQLLPEIEKAKQAS